MTDCFRLRGGDGEDSSLGFFSSLFGDDDSRQQSAAVQAAERARLDSRSTKELANKLDIDTIGQSFTRFAGTDQKMDKDEYERFVSHARMLRTRVWVSRAACGADADRIAPIPMGDPHVVTANDAVGFGATEADGRKVGAGVTIWPKATYPLQGTIWVK